MEWVSHLAGEGHSDQPACVSPVVRAFCIALNDTLEDKPRQRLRPYLARTIGTAKDGLDEHRAWMAMDWLIRVYAPAWLRVAGLTDACGRLQSLEPVLERGSLPLALSALERARRDARSAWSSSLARSRPATWIVPWAAGRTAAREAAWGSAGAAVWGAARVAVGDIAGDRARAAARAAAGDAAAVAARVARPATSRASARQAVREALAPTLDQLQDSALQLLDRMLPTVELLPTPRRERQLVSAAG
jgi:hypothetical protein